MGIKHYLTNPRNITHDAILIGVAIKLNKQMARKGTGKHWYSPKRLAWQLVINQAWTYALRPELLTQKGMEEQFPRMAKKAKESGLFLRYVYLMGRDMQEAAKEMTEEVDVPRTSPDICVEIHRYSSPEDKYRFFWFKEDEDGHEYPYESDDGVYSGPAYSEVHRQQVDNEAAVNERDNLKALGYHSRELENVGFNFAQWVIHTQCPVEWQKALDDRDPEMTKRVTVWMRPVDFPHPDHEPVMVDVPLECGHYAQEDREHFRATIYVCNLCQSIQKINEPELNEMRWFKEYMAF